MPAERGPSGTGHDTAAHGVCPACGATLGLTQCGKIVSHTVAGRTCRGSQRYPEYQPGDAPDPPPQSPTTRRSTNV